jgi:hypothetical protein
MNGLVALFMNKRKKRCKHRPISEGNLPSFILVKAPIHSRLSAEMTPSRFDTCDEPMYLCILSNNALHDMFKEFARQEVSIENIKIWDLIQHFRAAKNYDERQQIAHHIYNTYLAADAPLEVNLPKSTRELVWHNIEEGVMGEWLFDQVEAEVKECLEDICARFLKTNDYKQFMQRARSFKKKKNRLSMVCKDDE